MPDTPAPSYARADSVETSTAGDRVVLYDRRSRCALVLNPTGSRVWALLSAPMTLDGLAGALARQYPEVPVARARQDVRALLDDLQSRDMVVSR